MTHNGLELTIVNCPYCNNVLELERYPWCNCSYCIGAPSFLAWPDSSLHNYYSSIAYFQMSYALSQDNVLYRIYYHPNTETADVYYHTSEKHENDLICLVQHLPVSNIQPHNIKKFLQRCLQLKAFL